MILVRSVSFLVTDRSDIVSSLGFWTESIGRVIETHQIPLGSHDRFDERFPIVAFNSGENPVLLHSPSCF